MANQNSSWKYRTCSYKCFSISAAVSKVGLAVLKRSLPTNHLKVAKGKGIHHGHGIMQSLRVDIQMVPKRKQPWQHFL